MNEIETILTRSDDARPTFPLANEMFVEKGSVEDWNLLHDLHYKAEKLPLGPHYWKLTLHGQTIGVMVVGMPKGMVRERHMVFPNIKPTSADTKLTNTNRFHHINQNFRVVSRFVIDTMYRGIGAGYRMMNLVSRMEPFTYMEIQSSMSKFNLFGQKAGYKFVKPLNANNYEIGLKFFRRHFHANPSDFEAIVNEIEASANRDFLLQECKLFYRRRSAQANTGSSRDAARARIAEMTTKEIVKAVQQVALASPMYGIFKNPDLGRKDLPDRMPLTAFDFQRPDEPLRWKP